MLSSLRQASPVRIALLFIVIVTLFRLWYMTQIGLVGDEAYYWLWAKHPALSYRDKGPLVAWIIWLGTKLFGDTVFGIRFFGVLMSSATGWLIFILAKRLYDERTALWCILMALAIPELAVGSILMTIDTPSVFFWALAVLLFWDALQNNKLWTWFWLGLAIGAGFLAKFTNGVQLICIGFFLLWSREHRRLLFSPGVFVMSGAFLLASIPIIWWNVQTGWVHVSALHARSGVTDSFHIRPDQLLRFIGEQCVISPFFLIGMVGAAFALLIKRQEDLRTRFLLSQYLPIYALFTFFALNKAGEPNWTAPALVTGIVFTVVFWRELAARKPIWRWCAGTSFVLTAIATIAMHASCILPLPHKYNILHRAQGWPDFAVHAQKVRVEGKVNLLVGSDYSLASLMAFYLPDHPTTYVPPAPYGSSQFSLWPGYNVTPDTRALLVTWDIGDRPPEAFQKQFSKIQLMDSFWTQYRGHPMKHICLYLCAP